MRGILCFGGLFLALAGSAFGQPESVRNFPRKAEEKMDDAVYYSAAADPAEVKESLTQMEAITRRELRIALATNKSLQGDLELVDSQQKQIEDKWNELNKKLTAFGHEYTQSRESMQADPKNSELRKKFDEMQIEEKKLTREIFKEYGELIDSTLLSHQKERLESITSYLAVRNFFPGNSDQLQLAVHYCKAVGLDADELRRVQSESKRIMKDFEKKVSEAREEAKKSFLETIPENKRGDLSKIMDGEYQFLKDLRR
jgi:hypothetical protein